MLPLVNITKSCPSISTCEEQEKVNKTYTSDTKSLKKKCAGVRFKSHDCLNDGMQAHVIDNEQEKVQQSNVQ